MDRPWQATVHRVAKSWTGLSDGARMHSVKSKLRRSCGGGKSGNEAGLGVRAESRSEPTLAKLGWWQCTGEKETERGGILKTEVAGFVKDGLSEMKKEGDWRAVPRFEA